MDVAAHNVGAEAEDMAHDVEQRPRLDAVSVSVVAEPSQYPGPSVPPGGAEPSTPFCSDADSAVAAAAEAEARPKLGSLDLTPEEEQTLRIHEEEGAEAARLRKQEEEDAAMAAAMDLSLNESEKRDRPGAALSLPKMAEFGVSFERQPDGSDTCAIHSLNNLTQPLLSPEAAADISAARVAASVAAECGEQVALEGMEMQRLFTLTDLQLAEAECRREECDDGFLPAVASSLLSLRCDSGALGDGRSPKARSGMFEVEAVKVAAHNKGFEVIEVEPTPCWEDASCGAAQYAQAARDLEGSNSERWLLGFLVYERIPGRAMHYYSILRRTPEAPGQKDSEHWLVLDGLDREQNSPRNRLMTFDDMTAFYNRTGEWFRSWRQAVGTPSWTPLRRGEDVAPVAVGRGVQSGLLWPGEGAEPHVGYLCAAGRSRVGQRGCTRVGCWARCEDSAARLCRSSGSIARVAGAAVGGEREAGSQRSRECRMGPREGVAHPCGEDAKVVQGCLGQIRRRF